MAQVLVVCTANRCRSPIGEHLLRQRLLEHGSDVTVVSAGFMESGSPAVDEVVAVMQNKFGIDVSQHRSRRLNTLLLNEVDLVLTMERRHVREIAVMQPAAFGRTFTVREFARRMQAAPYSPGLGLNGYVALLSTGRSARSFIERDPADEIIDPIGKPYEVFEKTAGELDQVMASIAAVLSTAASDQ
jgi:protein-tyrosine phosphatase